MRKRRSPPLNKSAFSKNYRGRVSIIRCNGDSKASVLAFAFHTLFFVLEIHNQVPNQNYGKRNRLGNRNPDSHQVIRLFRRYDMENIHDCVVHEMVSHGHVEVAGQFVDHRELETNQCGRTNQHEHIANKPTGAHLSINETSQRGHNVPEAEQNGSDNRGDDEFILITKHLLEQTAEDALLHYNIDYVADNADEEKDEIGPVAEIPIRGISGNIEFQGLELILSSQNDNFCPIGQNKYAKTKSDTFQDVQKRFPGFEANRFKFVLEKEDGSDKNPDSNQFVDEGFAKERLVRPDYEILQNPEGKTNEIDD